MLPKKVIIVHGWEGSPDEPMHEWLRGELEAKGFLVLEPRLPHPEKPTIDEWVPYLAKIVGKINANTFFIGHSIGCQTILRYLEALPPEIKVGGAFFIAGWFTLKNLETKKEKEIAQPWLETPLNFEKIKSHTNNFTAVFSDNDPFVPLSDKNLFEKNLGAKTSVEHKMGHFDQASDIKEVPTVLKAFLKMTE